MEGRGWACVRATLVCYRSSEYLIEPHIALAPSTFNDIDAARAMQGAILILGRMRMICEG